MKGRGIIYLLLTGLLLCSRLSAEILIQIPVWNNLPDKVINKNFTNNWWNVDLFCRANSGGGGYIAHLSPSFGLDNTMLVFADPCFNRLIYNTSDQTTIRAFGSYGSSTGQFATPLVVKVQTPVDYSHLSSTYYNVYVADRDNNRVERLKCIWSPNSGMNHVQYYTGTDINHPVDVEVDNAGTFYPETDDYLWIAGQNNKICRVNARTGSIYLTYGSTGTGIGQFNGIKAIAAGKSKWRNFANNDTLYVVDGGNSRLVLLERSGTTLIWKRTLNLLYNGAPINDVEVDVSGNVWLASDVGRILKFTSTLIPLGNYGEQGTDDTLLYHPVSISNSGGFLGGGEMLITEPWSSQTGIKLYNIATDITDLYANVSSGPNCTCSVYFNLSDWSDMTSGIYDSNGTLIVYVEGIEVPSGPVSIGWNGRYPNGTPAPAGQYTAVVTAYSEYKSPNTGLLNNIVTKSTTFNLCVNDCHWLVGDANGDNTVNISDAVYLIQFVFGGGPAPQPNAVGSGDADCSHDVNISDTVYMINFIFGGGSPPGSPPGHAPCTCADYN